MATDTQTDAPFSISSLIGSAGVGSNGEKLVNALTYLYPEALTNAQLLTPNNDLTKGLKLSDVQKVVGDGVDVRDAVVRGGELHSEDAWVTYAGYDGNGDTVKGAFPYSDVGKSSSDEHVSQTDRLQESEAARDHALAQAKADAASADSEDVAELRQQVEALAAKLDEQPAEPLPVDQYDEATAANIAKMVTHADRVTAERVLDYERRHDDRSTVTEAAEKRIAALDAEQQAVVDENEALKKRVEELEAAAKADGSGDGS